jgi:polyhydroxybutyrate depolymerase
MTGRAFAWSVCFLVLVSEVGCGAKAGNLASTGASGASSGGAAGAFQAASNGGVSGNSALGSGAIASGGTGTSGGAGGASAGGSDSVSAGGGASSAGGVSLDTGGANGAGGAFVGTGGDSSGAGASSSGGTAGGSGATASGGESGAAATGGSGGAATVQCSSATALAAGETTQTIQVGGVSRSYILHVPAKYTGGTPVPLVVDFHPNLETAQFERLNSGYATLSDQNGFIIAFPQGIDNSWNVGVCCTTSRTVDDLGFAKALVAEVESKGCIDTKRVYATGYSMGGGMSLYLACNAADVFATVTSAAYDLYTDAQEPCHPSRPITVMTFRGTADPIETYGGGDSSPPNGLPVIIDRLGAVGTFQKWAMLDACTDTTPQMGASGCQTYSHCSAGVEVTLCTTQGGGHVTGDPNAGWAMMQQHPMP